MGFCPAQALDAGWGRGKGQKRPFLSRILTQTNWGLDVLDPAI